MRTDHHDTASAILAAVRDAYGITFTEVYTGGGCYALEARLESGHWIVATDEGLCGFVQRIGQESCDGIPAGWSIGVYANNTAHGDDWWGGGDDALVDIVDYDATADNLPAMVGRALAAMVGR